MESLVFLNGEIILAKDAHISPFDYGYLYGYGLFETMRAYQGKVFRIQKHLNRLYDAARCINIGLDKYNLEKSINDTIEANKLSDARIRLTVSRGEGEITPNPASCKTPTIFIAAQEYIPLPDSVYHTGCIIIVSGYQRNSVLKFSAIKSVNYLISILARTEARALGADEALLLNEKYFVSEATMSNVFIFHNNCLVTPPVDSGALAGITRQAVMELAFGMGIKVYEKNISMDLLEKADELFLTNSLIEILPVCRIKNKEAVTVKKVNMSNQIREAYRKLVSSELKLS